MTRESRAVRDPDEGLNADGTIRTGADRSRVPTEFEPVVAAVLEAFDLLSDDAAELHLYGSVANGTARPGKSDVDVVGIDVPEDWARQQGGRLSAQFSELCRGVEMGCGTRDDYLADGDEAYGNRVFLRHYCVPLGGPDALRSPTPFHGDARAARGFNGDIGLRLAQWRAGTPRPRAVARKTLFAAAGVISVLDSTWTTDRATAARRWGEIEPHRAGEMAALLAWADDDGAATAVELAHVLAPGGIVAAVVDRFATVAGLWPGGAGDYSSPA
jgi:hypothetical protein